MLQNKISAFAGAKYIFTQFAAGDMIEISAFLKTLIAICLFTIIFGRFFCGYACAFGTCGDIIFMISSGIQKKIKKKLPKLPPTASGILKNLKYIIMAGILFACIMGIYDRFRGTSPWDVFSVINVWKIVQRKILVPVMEK
ncbi:MAG: 4Fe-4S binding protein [Lachnospiraceae bacterium]|nr:4Fe-4S binding protein [Lachnospiraceae bacterium]